MSDADATETGPVESSADGRDACAECGRRLDPERATKAPPAAKLVCDAHVEAAGLLARRKISAMRLLAQKHGFVAVVPAAPTEEAER